MSIFIECLLLASGLAVWLSAVARLRELKTWNGRLPCPWPHCTNKLPVQGLKSGSGHYIAEQCDVCAGWVERNARNDYYDRVEEPTAVRMERERKQREAEIDARAAARRTGVKP